MEHHPVIIAGAGPAGLTAAHELTRQDTPALVLEKADKVGGLSRTEAYKGYRFDIGGHRFFTKIEEIDRLWQEMLGPDFLKIPRLSRIYYKDKFFQYPLNIFNVLANLGVRESLFILFSYAAAKMKPSREVKTFEQWVTNRFGRRLYETFFKEYTEKVWGVPCNELQADWASQRIGGLSISEVILNAIFKRGTSKTLIKEFSYPVLGPGMMWERFQTAGEDAGGQVRLNHEVVCFNREGTHVVSVLAGHEHETVEMSGDYFLSSIPLSELIHRLHPQPPDTVLRAASGLRYRAFILVGLIANHSNFFPDNWIYIHNPEVMVGRIQNFQNWSPAMVPEEGKGCLGLEYFCGVKDKLWEMPDDELIGLASRELSRLGLAETGDIEDGVIFRHARAYPLYDLNYQDNLRVCIEFLKTLDNLQTIGRNGMHRYNNQDHSMLTAMMAVKNIRGEDHDLWTLNQTQEYLE